MNADILICCEKGYLENTAKLLIYSIRNFGGIIKDAPIYSYRPREGAHLDQSTLDYFAENNVTYVPDVLNSEFPDYPLANKPLVCAHREVNTTADTLIFLDSDTMFFHSPKIFATLNDGEVLVRPVDRRNIGTTIDFAGETGSYWRELWEMAGIEERPEVRTTVGNEPILAYYNSGLIVTRTANGLMNHWKDLFVRVMRKAMKPRKMFFTEQSTYAAAIWSKGLKTKHFDAYYNCPIHNIQQCKHPDYVVHNLGKIVHAHYHKLFHNVAGVNPLYNEFEHFPEGRLINRKVHDFDLIVKQSAVRDYLRRARRSLKRLRKRVQKPR